ncbi:MAG: hypothetical protein HY701_13170 [Gemmatimonadetes bacterium]|nr:hypothetical protein [Gemmatimonadota bacterium]
MRALVRCREAFALSALWLAAVAGCGGDDGAPAGAGEDPAPAAGSRAAVLAGRIYERRTAFVGSRGDTTVLVPIFFTSQTAVDRVDREARGWLALRGIWDPFLDAEWHTPATRTPWRVIPYRSLRLVVGPEDALERILYKEGTRDLEVAFGATVTEWTGPRGEFYRVHRANAAVAAQAMRGTLVDMTRARAVADPPPGDWLFLVAGDTLQMLLDDADASTPADSGYRGWMRLGDEDQEWPVVRVTWTRVRAVEQARRDVPVTWHFITQDETVEGTLESRSSQIEIGDGPGPLLPVDALIEVYGSIRVGPAAAQVRGIARHIQR